MSEHDGTASLPAGAGRRSESQRWLKVLFFALVVRPLVLVVIGLNLRHRDRLPEQGPAIIAANHNSHLDTLVLMSLFPLRLLERVRPVAAADYFVPGTWLGWIARELIDIIAIERNPAEPAAGGEPPDVLAGAVAALEAGDIVILFPEGTRGAPEAKKSIKSGLSRLQQRVEAAPVVPVFLYGLGKALPKGAMLPVPFFCDVVVGESLDWPGSRPELIQRYKAAMAALEAEAPRPAWL